VTGVDVSSAAIALARDNARRKGVKCDILVADILEGMRDFTETFEFAHEWSVLHHIYPESRKQHVETVHRVLIPGGKYFLVAEADGEVGFGSGGKIRAYIPSTG
jgi:SAM-dependent methyltransferase